MLRSALPIIASLLILHGCSSSGDGPGTTSSGTGGGAEGLVLDFPCPDGEHLLTDGSCGLAGIPPDACADGFEADDDRGCRPLLPGEPCTGQEVALPGETTCRPLGDCGTTTWGNIPTDANTVHVDQSYAGVGDGSASAPFAILADAITAAPNGGTIAIAAGTYAPVAPSKALHLRGRCAQMVTIESLQGSVPGVWLTVDGSSLQDVAVTSPNAGIVVSADAVIERVDAFDNDNVGMTLQADQGPATIEIRDSLFRGNGAAGLSIAGALTVLVERTTFRDNLGSFAGAGLTVEEHPSFGGTPNLTMRDSVSRRNMGSGVNAAGALLTIERSVLSDNLPLPSGAFGLGLQARIHPMSLLPSQLTLRQTVVADNHYTGIVVAGSGASIEDVTVRRTLPQASDGNWGHGLDVLDGDTVALATTVSQSVFSDGHELGVSAASSNVTIRDSIVARTMPRPGTGTLGRGVNAQVNPAVGTGAVMALTASDIVGNHEAGVVVLGSTVSVYDVTIQQTQPQPAGLLGRAISAQALPEGLPASLRVERSRLYENAEGGVVVHGSNLELLETWIAATSASEGALYGDGVSVEAFGMPANASLTRVRIEGNNRVGLASFGSTVAIQDVELLCNAIHLNGEDADTPFLFEDRGGNRCGCGDVDETCKVLSAGLDPPTVVE